MDNVLQYFSDIHIKFLLEHGHIGDSKWAYGYNNKTGEIELRTHNFHSDNFTIHKDGEPAVGCLRYHVYFHHGLRHRLDGPAVIYDDGSFTWWVNNISIKNYIVDNFLTEQEIDLTNMTNIDKDMLKLFLMSQI